MLSYLLFVIMISVEVYMPWFIQNNVFINIKLQVRNNVISI